MYKKQLRFQKIVCLMAIVIAALYFIYSLGMITDIHDAMREYISDPKFPQFTLVEGAIIYYDMQPFNKLFTDFSVVLILLACLLFVTNTHVRRKYYIGNYIATGAYCVGTLALTIWSHIQIEKFAHQYMTTVNWEQLKEQSEFWKRPYLDNTDLLDAHYIVLVLAVLVVAALIVNAVWKVRLMRSEDELIKAGEEASV